jgi:hypothetical protein
MMLLNSSTGDWQIINYLSYFCLKRLPAASPLGIAVT